MKARTRIACGAAGVFAAISLVAACDFGGVDEGVQRPGMGGSGQDATIPDGGEVTATTCSRAGGTAGVKAVVADAMGKLEADCRIGAHFTGLGATAKKHMSDCFENYLGNALLCPGVTYAGSTDTARVACRNMRTSHERLDLSRDDYNAFNEAVISSLRDVGKLIPSEIGGVIAKFNAEQGIYDPGQNGYGRCTCPQGGPCTPPPPPPVDAGRDVRETGAPDTGGGNDAAPDTGGGGTDSGGGGGDAASE
jgi:hypothetical protein